MNEQVSAPWLELPPGFWRPQPRPWAELGPRANYLGRALVLEMCVRLAVHVPGSIIEFGVATGGSTRVIKRALRQYGSAWFSRHGRKQQFALDSFEGLREPFENAPVGEFAGSVPRIGGVNFIKGYFEDTCTDDLRRRVGRVAFAHFDADLHSSTLFALRWLTPLLHNGSLLLFDEFTGGDMAEARAFKEWQQDAGLSLIRIGEFDRDPSGYGSVVDRRVLFQVVGSEAIERRGRESIAWKVAYYCGRLNLKGLESRILARL